MKLISILFIVLIAGSTQAQKLKESEVPVAAKQAFTKKFPHVKSVAWSKENDTEFEAEYKMSGTEQSSNFDKEGKWLVTETEVKSSALPTAVQAILKKDFIDYKVKEVEKVENAANEIFYEMALEKGKTNLEVKISPEGKIISKEEKSEKEN
jgi:hypothetical protein